MKKMLMIVPLTALLLSACIVAPPQPPRVVMAPALPVIVELHAEPYYYQHGYYYYYDNNYWRYSDSRSGPWTDLPRSHYPKETKFKGQGKGRGKGQGHDRDHDHDRR
jgi:hypothetical protein